MKNEIDSFSLRPAEPGRDFGQLAGWFSRMEDEPTTEKGLQEWYAKVSQRVIQRVAQDDQGRLAGFYWLTGDQVYPGRFSLDLFVRPEMRRQGIGRLLYAHLIQQAAQAQAHTLRMNIRDGEAEGLAFATRRGFNERARQLLMELDLASFDDRPYNALHEKLQAEGFRFTSMEALGDTPQARQKLYQLNEATGMDIPGSGGERSWESFEDFQQRVCQASWYKPAGQMVVIDRASQAFVAMSAITRLPDNDYAYNLHTGVDGPYRGRKLAQAVKVLALRYAREVLLTPRVRTHHNALNQAMIAIDRKFGYQTLVTRISLEKML